jgi:moderate conductance mechanosensitive channel
MFYLLDDAFRVGEYIVADRYKGTVESFSLRSIKLRHHRGPLYTIPFGSLGAIQNMSREWVIDKISFTVTYDSDPAKIKRIVKEVSKQLQADPELAAGFIEPLKSQGVDAIADSGIIVRLKFKARPGTQFQIRRRANAALLKAFTENGVEIAFPTVRIAGEAQHDPAAAAKAMLDAQAATKAAE